jgi:beta-aspartyl-peptidase (threonine type)
MRSAQPVLVVHGGAGKIPESDLPALTAGCDRAARVGWQILANGGSALDAVQAAVEFLEDDPRFNAGTGAALNAEGGVQLDASIMDGATLAAGAVAAVNRLRNPIRLARRILDDGRHVLLVADGAHRFAESIGLPLCEPEALITEEQHRRAQTAMGTVGAVALDAQGRLAAATSTGGRRGSLPGRVGDSALIGCGTYADNYGAVSCTGIGEAIIRVGLARTAVDRLRSGVAPGQAAKSAIASLAKLTRAEAGLIMVGRDGRVGQAHNAVHMPVCVMRHSEE